MGWLFAILGMGNLAGPLFGLFVPVLGFAVPLGSQVSCPLEFASEANGGTEESSSQAEEHAPRGGAAEEQSTHGSVSLERMRRSLRRRSGKSFLTLSWQVAAKCRDIRKATLRDPSGEMVGRFVVECPLRC